MARVHWERAGIDLLHRQGRVHEVVEREGRTAAIAKAYALQPENTIIVSADNASRREINHAVRVELQERGLISVDSHYLPTLLPRSELTGADRRWASMYHEGDVLHYSVGSKELGIKLGSYANVTAVDAQNNRITVTSEDGASVAYDPKRLKGVSAYQEIGRDFSRGDRIQFTAPSRILGVANRDLATIQSIHEGQVTAKLDERDQIVTFDAQRMRHFDHGYALTSHSSQGVTTQRVLVNMDTRAHPDLISTDAVCTGRRRATIGRAAVLAWATTSGRAVRSEAIRRHQACLLNDTFHMPMRVATHDCVSEGRLGL